MHPLLITLAVGLSLAGPTFFYLSLPHQKALAEPWSRGPSRLAGWLVLLAAWGLWSSLYQAATGLFITLTFAMIAATALPFLIAMVGPRAAPLAAAPQRILSPAWRWLACPRRWGWPVITCERMALKTWNGIEQRLRLGSRWRWAYRRSRAQRAFLRWPWASLKSAALRRAQAHHLNQRATALERRLRLGARPAAAPPPPQEDQ